MENMPSMLYRGVTFDPATLQDAEAFAAVVTGSDGLTPGPLHIDKHGNRCVYTGDEYGVYMTPDPDMAESYAVADIRDQRVGLSRPYLIDGQPVACVLPDDELGSIRHTLQMPSVGVVYAIRTAGLPDLRHPRYRDGRNVTPQEIATIPELIVDKVPAQNMRALHILIGPDIMQAGKLRIDPNTNPGGLHKLVSTLFASRLGNLAFFAKQLERVNAEDSAQTAHALSLARAFQ